MANLVHKNLRMSFIAYFRLLLWRCPHRCAGIPSREIQHDSFESQGQENIARLSCNDRDHHGKCVRDHRAANGSPRICWRLCNVRQRTGNPRNMDRGIRSRKTRMGNKMVEWHLLSKRLELLSTQFGRFIPDSRRMWLMDS